MQAENFNSLMTRHFSGHETVNVLFDALMLYYQMATLADQICDDKN